MPKQSPHSPEEKNGKVVSAVDWLGHRFSVGERVMYCISAGYGQMMAIGEVIQIVKEVKQARSYREAEPGEEPEFPGYRAINGTVYPGRMSVYTDYDDITVQVKTLKTSGHWNNRERTRPAWVNPMNITALNPAATAALLEG
jgi:hypothetical protein